MIRRLAPAILLLAALELLAPRGQGGAQDRDGGGALALLSETTKLTASDAAAGDAFGTQVAISGDTFVIGAVGDDDIGFLDGAAYIFVRSDSAWVEQQKLTADDGIGDEQFGLAVAISGDTALIGAPEDDVPNGQSSGSAYVFTRSGSTWTLQQKLTADDGEAFDRFGKSVAISDDTAVIGAPGDDDLGSESGSAHVFVRSGSTWALEQKLTASDGESFDDFSTSVAISGDIALIGAPGHDTSGAAYFFTRSGSTWTEQQQLTASDAAGNDNFGHSLAISGDTAILGAYLEETTGSFAGAAYVFTLSDFTWTEQQKLIPSDPAASDFFGESVSISGDAALIGSRQDDDQGTDSGSAYVFVRSETSWAEFGKLIAPDGAEEDAFGFSVAVSGDIALIGAHLDDDDGSASGSAYVVDSLFCPPLSIPSGPGEDLCPPESSANFEQSGDSNDPVNTLTGELFKEPMVDLFLGGPLPVFFGRYYASKIASDGRITSALGTNWLHNFDMILSEDPGAVTVVTSQGRTIEFVENAGEWELTGKLDVAYQLVESGAGFVLLDPRSRLMFTFDAAGKLTEIADGRGNAHSLSYGGAGLLTQVADGLGRVLTFTYNVDDQLESVSDGIRTVTFGHTGDDLTSSTDARGNTTTYTYAAGGLMTAMTRPEGNTPYSQTFDGVGRVATQTDADGNTHTFDYVESGTTMTDPLGDTRVHTHTATGELSGHQSQDDLGVSMSYSAEGRRSSITDRLGDTTSYTYHAPSGQLASATHADGTISSYGYTARGLNGFTFHDLTSIDHPDGTAESFVYDAVGNLLSRTDRAGKVWSFTYDGNGQLLTSTNPLGATTTNTYNGDGTLATRTDPSGNTTTYGYDALRRPELVTYADTTTRASTYDANDNLLTTTNERGETTTFTYDANDNLATVTDALGQTTTFVYDGLDRLLTTTDPLGETTSQTWDELERLATVTDRNGNTTTFGYDDRGQLVSVTDGAGKIWSRTYDVENILASTTDPLGQTATFVTDEMARLAGATSPLAHTTSYDYDSMGRLTALTDPLGATSTWAYEARGLPSSAALPEGIGVSYTRNDLGRVTSLADPNGNDWLQGYDARGRLVSRTDPLGRATAYSYDVRNRVSEVDLPASGLTLTYDEAGNVTRRLYTDGTDLGYTFDALDRLTAADGLTLGYDANGQLTESNGITFTRDAGGRIETVTLAPGKTITYGYDGRSFLTQITDWLAGVTLFGRDDAGRLTSIERPNGITTLFTYDAENNLVGIEEVGVSSIALVRDANGQVTKATRSVPEAASIEEADSTDLAYDAASQVSSFTYDAMGRLTADETRTYVWDLASRLTSYTEDATTVSFTYDALGNRLSRTEGAEMRSYVWNLALALPSVSIERLDGSDLRYYVHMPGGLLVYSLEVADGARRDYHFDELGNTLFVSGATGEVLASYAYGPYGRLLSQSGSLDNPFTWQGSLGVAREGESGLHHSRARYYDAATGRFISRDPARLADPRAANPYQYALANPLALVDPMGTDPDRFLGSSWSSNVDSVYQETSPDGGWGFNSMSDPHGGGVLLPEFVVGAPPGDFAQARDLWKSLKGAYWATALSVLPSYDLITRKQIWPSKEMRDRNYLLYRRVQSLQRRLVELGGQAIWYMDPVPLGGGLFPKDYLGPRERDALQRFAASYFGPRLTVNWRGRPEPVPEPQPFDFSLLDTVDVTLPNGDVVELENLPLKLLDFDPNAPGPSLDSWLEGQGKPVVRDWFQEGGQ